MLKHFIIVVWEKHSIDLWGFWWFSSCEKSSWMQYHFLRVFFCNHNKARLLIKRFMSDILICFKKTFARKIKEILFCPSRNRMCERRWWTSLKSQLSRSFKDTWGHFEHYRPLVIGPLEWWCKTKLNNGLTKLIISAFAA